MSFSLSEYARTGGNLEEVLNTHPLLMKLGHGEAPAMRSSNYENVAVLEYDESYLAAALEAGGEWFKAGDWRCARRPACRTLMLALTQPVAGCSPLAIECCACLLSTGATCTAQAVSRYEQRWGTAAATCCLKRAAAATHLFERLCWARRRPFAWRGQLWLAHWIIFAPGEERMAISAVDEATGLVRLVHVLSPLPARVEAAQHVDGSTGAEEAESLSAVQGSSFAREKCAPAHRTSLLINVKV